VPARVQLPAVFAVLPFFHELETSLAFPLKKKSYLAVAVGPENVMPK
jgi:hypothetical protein